MVTITDLLGFNIQYDENGNIEVLNLCNYPSQSKDCFFFFKHLELLNIYNSGIEFPLHLRHWKVTITPDNEQTIKKYYCIDGLKLVLDENKSKLKNRTTFFKPEIKFPPNSIYPNFILNFYQVDKDGGIFIIDDLDMFENCVIEYSESERFTDERIEALNKLVNVAELQQIPFLPIELITFNSEGEINIIEQHLLAKKACK